jgi:predicted secreted hydrolase
VAASHTASIADRDEDYRRIGISRDTIEAWEDGARTDGRSGTYEWWYFDAHLDDGAKLVVIFMTKDLSAPKKPLTPVIRLNLDLPDGRSRTFIRTFPASAYYAAEDGADVRIDGNRFSGDLSHYRIDVELDDVKVHVTLDGTMQPWRPHTGYLVFGPDRDQEFSWLPAVPHGTVSGSYEIDGVRTNVTGGGYHDHNWGNVGMMSIINDWYWARGEAGPYSVIASYISAHKSYDYEPVPIFMLAKDGVVVADDANYVHFEATEAYVDRPTGKPVAAVTRYIYEDGLDRYVVTFSKQRDLVANKFVDEMRGWRSLAARLIRFDGAYLRFAGDLTIEHWHNGRIVDSFSDEAIWEIMYFGRNRDDDESSIRSGRA